MSVKATRLHGSYFASALLGCTVLAGVPVIASAQESASAPQASASPAAQAEQQIVRTIGVSGAQRLEPATIVSYIKLRPGDIYDDASADQALKDLAATELFSDFSIRIDDAGNVVIAVVENPVINRVILEGNRRLKSDKITPEIKLEPRQIFTRSKVRADVARIIELYKRQGRFAATVEPKMVQLEQNRVDVVFEINEGPKSKVRRINIIGNEAFSDGEIRSEMVTKEATLLKIFSSNTSYDPDRMAYDQQQVRAFYLENGYVDFRIISAVAELTPDKKDFIITYVVEEGKRYKFGDVAVESQLRDFDSNALTQSLQMEKGDWYDAKLVEDTVESFSEIAGTFGYAFADVRPQFTRNNENLTMDVRFVINEAPRVYLERVDVNGNTLTQDKVVRREFRIFEGDAFNSLQVKRSTSRINSLGFFQENFEIEQVETSDPDRIILEANVQEQPTGELTLSAGFSSLESFIFEGSIRQQNFRGRGQTVGLGVSYSRYSRSGNISFTEPYVFDKNISAGIDIYRRDYNNGYFNRATATYKQATTGIQFRAGIPLSEYVTGIARYTFNYDDVSIDETAYFDDFDGDGVLECSAIRAGRYLCDAIGKRTSSILGLSLIYSTLDSNVRPTRGNNVRISSDLAGLGGSTRYGRITANAAKYWNLGSDFIFSLQGEGGIIKGLKGRGAGTDNVLLTDRFFLGEPQLRGFDIRGVGPRVIRRSVIGTDTNGDPILEPIDSVDSNRIGNDSLGGKRYYFGRAELEIPLGSGAREMGLRPSIFIDVGAVWGVRRPELLDLPTGLFLPSRNADGDPLFQEITGQDTNGNDLYEVVTRPIALDGVTLNTPLGSQIPGFVEEFYGNSSRPRIAVGIGVDWNSPFGPFRINFAHSLSEVLGDDTKRFSFNIGTQF